MATKKKVKAHDKSHTKKVLKAIRDLPKKLRDKRKRDMEAEKKRTGG